VSPPNTALKVQHHAQEALYTMLVYIRNAVRFLRFGQYSKARDNTLLLFNKAYCWIHI